MTYKSSEKSFFEEKVEDAKEDLEKLEKKGARKALKLYDFGSSKLRAEMKAHPAQYFFLFISTFFGSVVTSSVALFIFSGNLLAQFSVPAPQPKLVAVASMTTQKVAHTKYDPLLLADKLKKNESDFELIDIRSEAEYAKGHILTAVNIPIYGTDAINKKGDLDSATIKKLFADLVDKDKVVIIYAQNSYASLPLDIVTLLTPKSHNMKVLAVGWEEWLHLQGK